LIIGKQLSVYKTKARKLTGSNYKEIYKSFFYCFNLIKKKSKRRPYIRSVYFNREKIFVELFLPHLNKKLNHRDKVRRMKYFPYAVDLIQNSRADPISKENPDRKSEILHRFTGETQAGEIFFVQIKEDKRTGKKWLISVFPLHK